ncbi:MAG: Phosphopantetheine adenylyltransferase [Bacteroidetes bacterium ADurb.Bin302]|nr:MAG: Phosphopantetheine adenylyltransferase [Bacteroidetes bacterium ADurb.Bin302]
MKIYHILKSYFKDFETFDMVYRRYDESFRYYHNKSHILSICSMIDLMADEHEINAVQRDVLYMAALYHDAIYDPKSETNERDSADLFTEDIEKCNVHMAPEIAQMVFEVIKYSDPRLYSKLPCECSGAPRKLIDLFISCDLRPFFEEDIGRVIRNYKLILREYQFVPYDIFVSAHLDFVVLLERTGWFDERFINQYWKYVEGYIPSIGVYAGSFNPFHIGHMSVLEQAERVFDKVIIATPASASHMIPIADILPYHEVREFEGLFVDHVTTDYPYGYVTVVRGLRNGNDLEYEINMQLVNYDLKESDFGYMYFITNYPHVSSTVVRDLFIHDRTAGFKYIPDRYNGVVS